MASIHHIQTTVAQEAYEQGFGDTRVSEGVHLPQTPPVRVLVVCGTSTAYTLPFRDGAGKLSRSARAVHNVLIANGLTVSNQQCQYYIITA